MADPVVHLTNGVPDSGTGNITTLGQTLVDGANATHGVTTGAAVITDAAGTFQQYLRGLVKLIAAGIGVTLNAETTKVIGVARTADGSGNLLTSTGNALDINIKSGVNANGQATKANSAPVVPATDWVYNKGTYVALPASTTTTIQSSAGAIGDYLDHITVFPTTTAAGSIVLKDGATTIATYAGGTGTALLTLTPFTIYVGAVSSVGAWSAVVGANVTGVAVGRFS